MRFLGSTITTGIFQGIQFGLSLITGQPSVGLAQPVFNLSPYWSNIFQNLLTNLPGGVGSWLSILPANMLSAIVNFVAGWILIGTFALLFFMLIGRIVGYVALFLLGGLAVGLFFGLIKL